MFASIRRFLAPPVFPDEEEKTRAASLLNIVLLSLTFLVTVIIFGVLLGGQFRLAAYISLGTFILVLLGLQIPMRRGHVKPASALLVLTFLPIVTAALASGGTVRAPGIVFYLFASIIAGLLVSRRMAFWVSIVNVVIVFGLLWAEINGRLLPPTEISITQGITFAVGSIFTVILLNLALQSIDSSLERARRNEREVRELASTLEQRVAERTRALATSAEVSRRLSTILDPDQLVLEVVEQVKAAFNYYHAHIYLLDEDRKTLNMVGGTGEAGREMLERGHSIPLARGLVGRAARTKTPVIVPDTTSELGWLPNPLLPETQAEIAVPIAFGETVLGVLDVQHNILNGLGQSDADLLQTIANQVAVALRNARQYEQSREREEDLSMMMEFSPEAIGFVNTQTGLFESVNSAAERLYGLPREELTKVGPAQMSPEFQPDGRPSQDAAMEKIGEALQGGRPVFEWTHTNASGKLIPCEVRLVGLTETRSHLVRFSVTDISERKRIEQELAKRAERDRVLARISTKIRGAVSMEQVLQVATQEVRQATRADRSVAVIEPNEETIFINKE